MVPKLELIYDGDCPVCQRYAQVTKIREDIGELTLINARESATLQQEMLQQGFNLDDGMVLKIDEMCYHGADALHVLAMLSSRSGLVNKVLYTSFKSKRIARISYPVLRFGRGLLLKLLGKKKIHPEIE